MKSFYSIFAWGKKKKFEEVPAGVVVKDLALLLLWLRFNP